MPFRVGVANIYQSSRERVVAEAIVIVEALAFTAVVTKTTNTSSISSSSIIITTGKELSCQWTRMKSIIKPLII